MYKKKSILGLIPARGGSKGIFRKNIKLLLGKPLIAWTIEQTKKSRYIDKVIVSTDDKEIAKISERYGAEVPFMRPKGLATDKAKCLDVVLHAIDFMEEKGEVYDILMLLQPTSPLRAGEDIDNAIKLLFNKNANAIISICEMEHHPYKANTLPPNGCMKKFIKKENLNKNRQELDVFYRENGAIYLAYCDYIRKQRSFFGEKTFAYLMPIGRSIDIDSGIDLKLVEVLKKGR